MDEEPVELTALDELAEVAEDDLVYVVDVSDATDSPEGTSKKAKAGALRRGYTHDQSSPTTVWSVTHNLGRRPSVTVVDTAGTVWVGKVEYLSDNAVRISFGAAFAGKAYLN